MRSEVERCPDTRVNDVSRHHSHLDRILRTYAAHYNTARPHRGIELRVPESAWPVDPVARAPGIRRRDLLGGLIHEYEAVAA